MKVGIIGGGSWGKALATLVAGAGHQPRIGYRGHRPTGFPGTPNLNALTQESDLVVVAVPSDAVAKALEMAQPDAASVVVFASRGMDAQRGVWMSEYLVKATACRRVGALAGPALASEVAQGRPTAMVVASPFDEVCVLTQKALHSEHCRIYTSSDLRGVELSGAMVKTLSVAVGLADGVDYGAGAKGVIITRGIAEASRLGAAIGAHPRTFWGLAGVGDLVSCAASENHPNYAAGLTLARGGAVSSQIIDETRALLGLAESMNVELPLTEAVLAIATGESGTKLAFDELMRREARSE